jgi:hypothetical protein
MVKEQLEAYKVGERVYSKEEISATTELSVKKVFDIITEYYSGVFREKGQQWAELMHEFTFGRTTTTYPKLAKVCEENGFELVTTEEEWFDLVAHRGTKSASELKVIVKCKAEGHITEKTINGIRHHGCLYCGGQFKNQRRTHAIAEAAFGDYIIKIDDEVGLIDIITDVGINPAYDKDRDIMDVFRMRLDTYIELNIKDKNGKYIKLAIEAQGDQHKRTEEEGLKTFLVLNHFKGQEGDPEWDRLRIEWKKSLKRDALKVNAFKNNNDKGYYLIEVYHEDIKPRDRASYILNELHKQAGVDLRHLAANVNVYVILNRVL